MRSLLIGLNFVALAAAAQAQEQYERPVRSEPATAGPEVPRHPLPVSSPEAARSAPTPAPAAAPQEPAFDQVELSLDASGQRWSRVHHGDDRFGALWVRGRDFKASAAAEGFTFIPFLGSDAPQAFPVEFQLASVVRDGAALEITPTAAVSRAGDRLVLDRGAVEVRYDVTTDATEQSFALDVPAGSGDLVLAIDVETELDVAPLATGGFRFSTDRGGVDYGAAVVLDAEGRRAAVPSRWTGAGIELVVPASFLAHAVGPIVVDPVISTFAIDTYPTVLLFPDAAYDLVNDRFLVVYEELFTTTDSDVYSIFVDATTGQTSGGSYVDFGGNDWTEPCVAILRGPGRFLVAALAPSVVQAGEMDIRGRFRDVSGSTFEPDVILKGATSSYGCVTPDLAGEGVDFATSNFCLVYGRDYGTDTDIAAIILDPDGNFVGAEKSLSTIVTWDERNPAVSKSTGDGGGSTLFCVAWEVEDQANGNMRVDACQLSFAGSTVTGPFALLPFSASNTYFDVAVSELSNLRHPVTNQQYWVVTYDDGPSSISDGFVALCSGDEVHSTQELQVMEHASRASNTDDVRIATTGRTFQLAYRQGTELLVSILQPIEDRLALTERRSFIDSALIQNGSLTSASRFSGGSTLQDSLFAWSAITAGNTSSDIHGARVESQFGVAAAGYQYCYGEPNSTGEFGFLMALGDRDRSNLQTLIASGLPVNTFGIFVASLTNGSTPNPIGQGNICVAGEIGRLPVFGTGPQGRVERALNPQAIPQQATTVMAGVETWHFQAWHRDFVSGSQSSNFTNGVAIPFQ